MKHTIKAQPVAAITIEAATGNDLVLAVITPGTKITMLITLETAQMIVSALECEIGAMERGARKWAA